MSKKSIDQRDIERVKAFQQWCSDLREQKEISYQEGADRVNAVFGDELEWTQATFRQAIKRNQDQSVVTRSTCRRLAVALDADINQVLIKAGYLPDNAFGRSYELPTDIRVPYAALADDEKSLIHHLILEMYVRHQAESSENISRNFCQDRT